MNILTKMRVCLLVGLLSLSSFSYAQNRETAQLIMEDLCSDGFSGRGYINKGDSLAAAYISDKFSEIGLSKMGASYNLPFQLDINTILKSVISFGDKKLKPGYDYLVSPGSPTIKGTYKVFYVSPRLLASPKVAKKVKKAIRKGYLPVISVYDGKNELISNNVANIKKCNEGSMLVFLKKNLTWSVATKQDKAAEIWLLESSFSSVFDQYWGVSRPYEPEISVDVEAELIKNYQSQNVLGFVPGTTNPDSFIIFCGHYDHLGKMGEAIFYGANDNASGIAILIDMASYFKNNPQQYSIIFVAFGGEEAGLLGSLNYVKRPAISLAKTKFVFNMDLMGSGEKGATIVNGSVFKDDFDKLVKINTENDYLPAVYSRGKAANSDHYFFTEAGIPSFFIYLMGEYSHYHVPADNMENLQLGPYYDKSFLLIRDFIILLNE